MCLIILYLQEIWIFPLLKILKIKKGKTFRGGFKIERITQVRDPMRSLGRTKITKSISKKTIDLNNLELHCMVLQKFVCHTNWSKHFFSENAETKKFIGIIGLMSVNRLFATLIIINAMQNSQT